MKDIGVVNAPSGAPTLALTGGAAARLAQMVPPGHSAHIHLTLTDDHPWAHAFVIIEAIRDEYRRRRRNRPTREAGASWHATSWGSCCPCSASMSVPPNP